MKAMASVPEGICHRFQPGMPKKWPKVAHTRAFADKKTVDRMVTMAITRPCNLSGIVEVDSDSAGEKAGGSLNSEADVVMSGCFAARALAGADAGM